MVKSCSTCSPALDWETKRPNRRACRLKTSQRNQPGASSTPICASARYSGLSRHSGRTGLDRNVHRQSDPFAWLFFLGQQRRKIFGRRLSIALVRARLVVRYRRVDQRRTFLPTTGGQSLLDDLIAHGLTCGKGYVDEPLLQAIASPSVALDRYTAGYTMAESFYAASHFVGWEDIVIGDPLCAPYFGKQR